MVGVVLVHSISLLSPYFEIICLHHPVPLLALRISCIYLHFQEKCNYQHLLVAAQSFQDEAGSTVQFNHCK